MNEATNVIRKQIESCRELLKIFQNERQLYLDRPDINLEDVTRILCRKKQLVEVFDQQQQVIRECKEQNGMVDADNRELMRELGSILEQLLVIDHENEKLLRHCLSTRNPLETAMRNKSSEPDSAPSLFREPPTALRARPALQRQLPFVPGSRPMAPAAMTAGTTSETAPAAVLRHDRPAVRPEPAEPAEASTVRTAAKHLIRNYVQTAKMFNLSSKYA